VEVARLCRQDAADRDITLAWHVEALHRQKKLPSLKTLVRRVGVSVRQSAVQMRSALSVMSAQYGIPIRKAKKRI